MDAAIKGDTAIVIWTKLIDLIYQEFLIFKSKLELWVQAENSINTNSIEEVKSSQSVSIQKLKKRNKKLIEKKDELSDEDVSIEDCSSNKINDDILAIIDERFNRHANKNQSLLEDINRKYNTLENQLKSLIASRLDKIQSDIKKNLMKLIKM